MHSARGFCFLSGVVVKTERNAQHFYFGAALRTLVAMMLDQLAQLGVVDQAVEPRPDQLLKLIAARKSVNSGIGRAAAARPRQRIRRPPPSA